jgi:hypothetical protein
MPLLCPSHKVMPNPIAIITSAMKTTQTKSQIRYAIQFSSCYFCSGLGIGRGFVSSSGNSTFRNLITFWRQIESPICEDRKTSKDYDKIHCWTSRLTNGKTLWKTSLHSSRMNRKLIRASQNFERVLWMDVSTHRVKVFFRRRLAQVRE